MVNFTEVDCTSARLMFHQADCGCFSSLHSNTASISSMSDEAGKSRLYLGSFGLEKKRKPAKSFFSEVSPHPILPPSLPLAYLPSTYASCLSHSLRPDIIFQLLSTLPLLGRVDGSLPCLSFFFSLVGLWFFLLYIVCIIHFCVFLFMFSYEL